MIAGSRARAAIIAGGAAATLLIGAAVDRITAPGIVAGLAARGRTTLDAAGGQTIAAGFVDTHGWLTRHPLLTGGAALDDATRARAATALAALPGIGGVHWAAGPERHTGAPAQLRCQQEVQGVLRTRSIRFAEASAEMDAASHELLNEVAAALRPCAGSVIAITGHTDAHGDEAANLALSRARAMAVRDGLAARGIDMAGLRATGLGSTRPIAGLRPEDAANRRIEFSVIAPASLEPTPVDTPGAG